MASRQTPLAYCAVLALLLTQSSTSSDFTLTTSEISDLISNTTETFKEVRCMKYSWLGADYYKYVNESMVTANATALINSPSCADFPKKALKPIPCVHPFIIGASEPPNTTTLNHLVKSHPEVVTCKPGNGDVCAVVAFYYNDKVHNVTAYCTRVTIDGDDPLEEGCQTAHKGAYSNKVCVCQPTKSLCNNFIPNGAPSFKKNLSCKALILTLVSFLFRINLTN